MSQSHLPSDFIASGELQQPTTGIMSHSNCPGTTAGRLRSRTIRKAKRAIRSTALLAEFQERCQGVW
jgi:hypothetical protein